MSNRILIRSDVATCDRRDSGTSNMIYLTFQETGWNGHNLYITTFNEILETLEKLKNYYCCYQFYCAKPFSLHPQNFRFLNF